MDDDDDDDVDLGPETNVDAVDDATANNACTSIQKLSCNLFAKLDNEMMNNEASSEYRRDEEDDEEFEPQTSKKFLFIFFIVLLIEIYNKIKRLI